MSEILKSLIEQLSHQDKHLRDRAALALGNLGDSDALDALLQALCVEPDLFVRETITWALVKLRDVSTQPLIRLLKEANPEVRHLAAHTLGKIKDVQAVEPLINALQDSEPKVVMKVMFALSQIRDVRAITALIQQLGSENIELQTAINQALESFGSLAVPPLIQALTHERWQVREQAADLLGFFDDSNAISALTDALQDESWQVRFAAANALGNSKDAVHRMQNHPDQRVRGLASNLKKNTE